MIVSDVITRVRRVFGDEAAVQITNDDIIRWINDGQIEIVKHNQNALQSTDTINLVADQATYALNSNMLLLRTLRYKYSDMLSYQALIYRSMQQFDESIDGWDGTLYPKGYPVFFTQYNDSVILFPTPDRSATAGLKVLYNQKPADVSDLADPLSLPLIYHNTILRYCLWQSSLLDEELDPSVMYEQAFIKDMALLQQRETTEATATYPTITVLEFDQ
jgi:hypothetical protein